MSLTNLGGILVPTEWFYGGLAVFLSLIGIIVALLFVKKREPPPTTPIEIKMVLRQPVDEAGSLQMGELLVDAERTEDTLIVHHPDWVDDDGNPYHGEIPIDKELPLRFLDVDKNVNEMWIAAHRGEELELVSASTIVNKLPARFDPLPANPRKVGRFYVGWGFGKQGGLAGLVSTTTGKILAFGGVFLIGLFMGMLIIIGHVGHA